MKVLLIGKREGRKLLGKAIWKMESKYVRCDDVEWIHLTQEGIT